MLNQEKSRFEPKPDHSYVFEMFFQKSMEMFINRLIDNYDQIFEIGWGSTPLRLYPYYLRRENEKKVSVFFQISLQPGSFDYSFIRRNHKSFNSNPNQIKVIAKIHGSCFPENFDTDKAKDYLFGLVSKYPSVRPVIVDYNEKKHLFSGLRGNLLRSTDLIALFPLENIDHLVSNELRKFLLSAASSLLLVIITSILFYGLATSLRMNSAKWLRFLTRAWPTLKNLNWQAWCKAGCFQKQGLTAETTMCLEKACRWHNSAATISTISFRSRASFAY
jgi:hypothetical protein